MYIGRPDGGAWMTPTGPTAADAVEFNRDHYLAPNVVAYWVARGGLLQDMLGTVGDIPALNSGAPGNTLSGPGFGNASVAGTSASIASSTAWKPTAQMTIAGLFASVETPAGFNLFGTEGSSDGYGCYGLSSGTPHMYIRIGGGWQDQGVTGTWSQTPQMCGMTYDGATFAARWESNKASSSASGSIVQSTVALDILGYGGGSTPYGGSSGYCLSFLILDRGLSDDEWENLRLAPFQLLRTVRPPFGSKVSQSTTSTIAGTIDVTGSLSAAAGTFSTIAGTIDITGSIIAGGLHGRVLRRGRYRTWDDVPTELAPVVSLAENYADELAVQRAVDDALARFAAMKAKTSIARRERLVDDLKRAIVAAVEEAAETDDEDALIALL